MIEKRTYTLYIVDQDNERVIRYDLDPVGLDGYPFTGLTAIQSIAINPYALGQLYVSDKVAGFLKNDNNVVSALPVSAPIETPGGIFLDHAGLLYLTDSLINGTYRIDAQGHQTQISDFDSSHGLAEDSQGRIYFGTSTNVRVFTPAGELGTPAATKSMFSNTDQNNSLVYTMPHGQTTLTQVVSPTPPFFYDVETLSCPYIEIHGTCSFQVNFAPQVPGVHTGSIATTLPGGPTITTLLYGNATGPAPAFSPGTQTQTPSGAVYGENVALDEAGNYYVSDGAGNQVYETSGGVTRSLGFTGLSSPTSLAVDGAGAVYVLDKGNNRIAKLDRLGNQTYPVIAGIGNGLSSIDSFAMDGGGQIYFAGPAAGAAGGILELYYLYDRTGATSGFLEDFFQSAGLALDPYGHIYSIRVDGSLIRIDFGAQLEHNDFDLSGKYSTLAPAGTFHNHTSIAVDASETAYVAQDGVAAITLVHPDGTTESIPVPGLNHVGGIAVNGTGSILAVDSATNQYTFVDRTHQDFNFGDVPVNTTKTFNSFFGNAGTQPFNITGLPSDSDFKQVTSADACSISGVNATVAPASSCLPGRNRIRRVVEHTAEDGHHRVDNARIDFAPVCQRDAVSPELHLIRTAIGIDTTAGLPPVAQLVDEDPAMGSLLKHRANIRLLGSWAGKTKCESPLLGIQQGPVGGANNICLLVILPERRNILDENAWDRNRAAESVRSNACDEGVAHRSGFGQSSGPFFFLDRGRWRLSVECRRHNYAVDRAKEGNG